MNLHSYNNNNVSTISINGKEVQIYELSSEALSMIKIADKPKEYNDFIQLYYQLSIKEKRLFRY